MNKLFLIVVGILSFDISYSKECYDQQNYHTYYYINGINVTKNDSRQSIHYLTHKFKLKRNIKPLYNPTIYQGEIDKISSTFNEDKKETKGNLKRIIDTTIIGGLKLIDIVATGMSIANDGIGEFFPQKVDELIIDSLKENKQPLLMDYYLKHTYSNALVNTYIKELETEKSNIIIAHSQGNLLANEICNRKKEGIEIIAIGTPASGIPCNKFRTYALYDKDFVIEPLKIATNKNSGIFKYMDSNFEGINHTLSGYLDNETVLNFVSSNLEKTKNIVYNTNMNFNIVESNQEYVSILDKPICIPNFSNQTSGFFRSIINNQNTKDDNSCFILRNQSSLTEAQLKVLRLTSLGKTIPEIAASLISLKQTHQQVVSQIITNIPSFSILPSLSCATASIGSFAYFDPYSFHFVDISNDNGLFLFKKHSRPSRSISSIKVPVFACSTIKDLETSYCSSIVSEISALLF